MTVPHLARALSCALLVALTTLAASWGHSRSAPTHVNVAAASGSSPVHEQPLPLPRVGLGAATGADGRVYTIGGNGPENERDPNNERDLGVVEAYDPRSNTWATVASLPGPRDFAAAVTGPGGQIYVLGGNDLTTAAYFDTVLVYNPSSDHWVTLPTRLSSARWNLAAAAHPNGLIYALGGIGDCLVDVACPTQPTATSTPTNASTPMSVSVPAHTPAATTSPCAGT